jgi:phosphoribosylamine---glycine ligase
MGAYAPAPIATEEMMARVQKEVLESAIATLNKRGIDYRGVLYAGLMVSPDGNFKVLEFNCRFGDPETQVILPLLETPLVDLLIACAQQKLSEMPPIQWKDGAAATVVAASGGYPGDYVKGKVITGISKAQTTGTNDSRPASYVFHAGTKLESSQLLTDGGRVLNVTGTGEDFKQALAQAYAGIAQIKFEGMYYRRDIGHRLENQQQSK